MRWSRALRCSCCGGSSLRCRRWSGGWLRINNLLLWPLLLSCPGLKRSGVLGDSLGLSEQVPAPVPHWYMAEGMLPGMGWLCGKAWGIAPL